MADGPFAALYAMLDRDSEFERDVLELVDEAASQLDKYREARDAIRDRCEQLLRAVHDAVADLDVGDEADAYTKLTDALNSAADSRGSG